MTRGTRKPTEFDAFPIRFDDARAKATNRAVCKRVIDGDTFDFMIDLGLGSFTFQTIRLFGLDTPEVVGTDRARGLAAAARAAELILDKPCLLQTYVTRTDREEQTFGRFTASVWYWDGIGWDHLAARLKAEEYEKIFLQDED